MRSIQFKIMALLFCSIFISSLLIGIFGVFSVSNVLNKSTNDNMNLACNVNAEELDIIFAKVEDSVDTLAHYATTELLSKEALRDDGYRKAFTADIQKNARHHIQSTDGAMTVYIRYNYELLNKNDGFLMVKKSDDSDFTEITVTNLSVNEAEESWWYTPLKSGKPSWIQSYYDNNLKSDVISYVVPLYKESQFIGVMGADISSDYIEQIVKGISVLDTGAVALLENDGTVVYHPNFGRGDIIGENDPGYAGVIEQLTRVDKTDTLISYNLNGVKKKIASCTLRNGMLMICFAPDSEIYREQHTLTTVIIVIIVMISFVALSLAIIVSRKFISPIKKLNEAAKGLTDYNFNADISVETKDEIGELTQTFINTREVLKKQFDLLNEEAHRDGLTGVGNKSAFMDKEAELNTEMENLADLAVAVFDVNRLKITNDVFGHIAGDTLLKTVAEHLISYFNHSDIYRIGGDEFVVIATNENASGFDALVKECVLKMKERTLQGFPECSVSCAFGVARLNKNLDNRVSDVIRRADKEMYKNKAESKKDLPLYEGQKGLRQIQIEKYKELLQTLSASTDDYMFLLNVETGALDFFGNFQNEFYLGTNNNTFSSIFDLLKFVHPKDRALVKQTFSQISDMEAETININLRLHGNNNMHWVNCRGSFIKDENNLPLVMIGRISQNAVKHLYNPVTTLFNKTKLKANIEKNAVSQFSCLMLLDIDDLSDINFKHGTVYGDMLLKTLAAELESRFEMWQIYHAEKDRFVVLLDVNSSKEARRVFEEIKTSMEDKCSISASVVPNDISLYETVDNIYDYAVEILNNAKKNGTGQIVFFTKESLLERVSAVELSEEIENSVQNKCKGFHLVYQPQINANDYSLCGVEALLRYTSESKGQVYPDQFIPLLERTGLINKVGIWVANEALAQCRKWREQIPDFCVSVNVSPVQLKKKRTVAQIIRLLEKHHLPGEALVLEITESVRLEDDEEILSSLSKLRLAGIQIAIDDFGVGYANLSHLKYIHANIIKVDRIFVQDIRENSYNFSLIRNIIDFAKANGLKVCLEGIETVNELITLNSLKADFLQGYLFDKPCQPCEITNKYIEQETEEFARREAFIERVNREKLHSPIINFDTKAILLGINTGLWIIRKDLTTGESEIYTDATMRELLGVDQSATPKECYQHWYGRIKEGHQKTVDSMVCEMINSQNVIQAEYPWIHPTKNEVFVRCTGRCIEKNDDSIVFEGFHRIISDMGKSF